MQNSSQDIQEPFAVTIQPILFNELQFKFDPQSKFDRIELGQGSVDVVYAGMEVDQEYAEKMQAEQAEKETEARQAAEEKETVEKKTESRIKMYPHFWKSVKAIEAEVEVFLRLVAEGEQDQAEAMLKANGILALESGRITDLAKQSFNHITALQYAIRARDWHMVKMILNYLPEEPAALQWYALETDGTEHGTKDVMLETLIDNLKTYEQNYRQWNVDQRQDHWKKIDGTQLLLPAHVVNEYCYPNRPFYPVPDFQQESLPRVLTLADGKDWYTTPFCKIRGYYYKSPIASPIPGGSIVVTRDILALQSLYETREQQLQNLKADLYKHLPRLGVKVGYLGFAE